MGDRWRLIAEIEAQRGHLFNWVPVCMAFGIGAFFLLRFEPSLYLLSIGAAFSLALLFMSVLFRSSQRMPVTAFLCASWGFGLAAWQAHQVATPVLDWRYYGPVAGRIVGIDRSASDAIRLTLDQVRLEDVDLLRVPGRVRLSLHGDRSLDTGIVPGALVMTTAHLSPPNGPTEPGGFDFQRHSWFLGIGAVGYTRVPVLSRGPPDQSTKLVIFRIRMALSRHIQSHLPGDVGGFAAAITTGDRSGLSLGTVEALRVTNMAHLLAISGLHMGLLTGFIFLCGRYLLALVPMRLLRFSAKKYAAVASLIVGSVYLALSGGNIATERAFIMVCVAFVSTLFNRRAISLRAVAVAAIIVLSLRPEALLSPGFQMSFAATTALVAVFGGMRDVRWGPAWIRMSAGILLSSVIAGLATAPVGAAHFNQLARYGLLANVLSVPVMGSVVVPSAVLSVLLAPLGLEEWGLKVMGLGLRWILGVATWIAGWEDARRTIPTPPGFVLPLLALGTLWVILWQTRLRYAGLAVMLCALAAWATDKRPDVLIAQDGGIVGVLTPDGRALSKARGGGFVARSWLENDGDRADQVAAAARWTAQPAQIGDAGVRIWHVNGKRAAQAFPGCAPADLVVSRVFIGEQRCEVISTEALAQSGARAMRVSDGIIKTQSAFDVSGHRLWTQYQPEPPLSWWRFNARPLKSVQRPRAR